VLQAAFFSSPSFGLEKLPQRWLGHQIVTLKREIKEDLEESNQVGLRRRNKECIEAQTLSRRVSAQACQEQKSKWPMTYPSYKAYCIVVAGISAGY
jgi:hypothetical protein